MKLARGDNATNTAAPFALKPSRWGNCQLQTSSAQEKTKVGLQTCLILGSEGMGVQRSEGERPRPGEDFREGHLLRRHSLFH